MLNTNLFNISNEMYNEPLKCKRQELVVISSSDTKIIITFEIKSPPQTALYNYVINVHSDFDIQPSYYNITIQ